MRKMILIQNLQTSFEPCHEIMALFVLRKFILPTHMRSMVGLDIWFLLVPFVYFHTSCVRTAKALVRLRRCAGLPEPSVVAYVISTIIWLFFFFFFFCIRNFMHFMTLGNVIIQGALRQNKWRWEIRGKGLFLRFCNKIFKVVMCTIY